MVTFVSEFVEQDSTKKKKGKKADDGPPLTFGFFLLSEKEPLIFIIFKFFGVLSRSFSYHISKSSYVIKINDLHYP